MQLVRNHLGQVTHSPPEPCTGCGELMLGRYAYRDLPAEQRSQFRLHQARGLCDRCYKVDHGLRGGHEGFWRNDDLIYEWEFLAAQGYSRREAARRLHVSYEALSKAIERARIKKSEETAA